MDVLFLSSGGFRLILVCSFHSVSFSSGSQCFASFFHLKFMHSLLLIIKVQLSSYNKEIKISLVCSCSKLFCRIYGENQI